MNNLTPYEFWILAASLGSYIRGGDPGSCMYGFNESGLVQSEEHRARCIDWIDNHCMAHAGKKDKAELQKMKRYLLTAEIIS